MKQAITPRLWAKDRCSFCHGRGLMRRAKGRTHEGELVFEEVLCNCVITRQRSGRGPRRSDPIAEYVVQG